MFIYLSKKIAIPNNTKLKCIGWNKDQGYIACGGDEGLLKVLKLEAGKDGKVKGLAAPSNLSMNQTLEGHNGQIQVVTWNEGHQKLTSSDQYGLIIVWMLYKGQWYEEMINNRNKSVVKGMAWNADGQKICIVYEDGAVIVGSVDGNRIWGKELKTVALSEVCWSPDSRLLLFALASGEVHIYDNMGGFVVAFANWDANSSLSIQCLTNISQVAKVVSLQWYDGRGGFSDDDAPALAICYSNGRVQMMTNEMDDNPVLLDTSMTAVGCQWNHNGTVLAIAGTMTVSGGGLSGGDIKESNVVQFYAPNGDHLRTLKVPGKQITACAWEGGSLRIALAVDSFIYFANIRPDYKWAYFANTVVYTYPRPDRAETAIVFWNIKTQERHVRYAKKLYGVASSGDDHCVLATAGVGEEDMNAAPNRPGPLDDQTEYPYLLSVCNALGTTVDAKPLPATLEPLSICMTDSYVVAASRERILAWHYRTAQAITAYAVADTAGRSKSGASYRGEQAVHVDDSPTGMQSSLIELTGPLAGARSTQDPVCCVGASDKMLVVGRESGALQRYALPNIALVNKYNTSTKPIKLGINSNSTCISVIDVTGLLQFVEVDGDSDSSSSGVALSSSSSGNNIRQGKRSNLMKLERKDVWDMKWAADNPDLFAMMEKTRMYIFRNMEPEEPILSAGYICCFRDLEIRAVLLDEVIKEKDQAPNPEYILDLEVKSLRDTRDLLEKTGLKEAQTFIEDNPHPRLWRLLAEAAVEELELGAAENAYVRCKDYPGIQFVKRLQNVQDDAVRRAEVAAWFNRFDEAEKLFLDADRRDLAVALRRKLGDWFQVVHLLKLGSGGNDAQMEEAWNRIGDHYAERHKWEDAVQYYEKAQNTEMLIQCYYFLEDYSSLEGVLDLLQPDDKLLDKLGEMFASVGMGKQAVDAFIKHNNATAAIDTCVSLNQWHDAVELATRHNQPTQVSSLLAKYAQHLLDENKVIQAIELYRKANYYLDAAKLLNDLAKDETLKRASSPLRIKKLYVLSALLVEEHLQSIRKTASGLPGMKSSALIGLVGSDDIIGGGMGSASGGITGEARIVDNAWRGAEAFHFLMLCQRQLYEGFVDAAMKTALNLRDYDDLLNPEDVYCLLALASCANRAFGTCSKAFIKLESLEELTPEQREEYQELAMDIFIKQAPKDSRSNRSECANCETMIPDWVNSCPSCQTKFPICIMTGRPLMDMSSVWTCEYCHHRAYEQDVTLRQNCPLCHSPINL